MRLQYPLSSTIFSYESCSHPACIVWGIMLGCFCATLTYLYRRILPLKESCKYKTFTLAILPFCQAAIWPFGHLVICQLYYERVFFVVLWICYEIFVIIAIASKAYICTTNTCNLPHVIYLFHILCSFLKRFWFIVLIRDAGGWLVAHFVFSGFYTNFMLFAARLFLELYSGLC